MRLLCFLILIFFFSKRLSSAKLPTLGALKKKKSDDSFMCSKTLSLLHLQAFADLGKVVLLLCCALLAYLCTTFLHLAF